MIRVMIAEDQRLLRGALGTLLNLEDDIEVIAEVGNGEEAFKAIVSLQPDVCLMDIEMPIKSGLDVAEELKQLGQSCKIIILTTFARPGYFKSAVNAGVHGYLLKDGPIDELVETIRKVMDGKREYAPELVFGSMQGENPLTEREREIMKLVAEGKTAKEISAQLFLSSGTVRNYISEVINKLNVKNRIEAISVAQEKGWL